ncbi:non-lysosomal glucosylceramidase [Microlunatus panaciterrae]|uniref:Uncharacterized protein (DUF608 family) n=1 Tax=Microlunatus panaciterrae TaxID=400768 RepID=A0ABS2RPR7_9ACTN|nr:GH116 family glycosyl-hydrolase [Microlunatus panaciterrae]MBM7800738.1 uncharacterized protein (DUF608 family) [Microlunatus panaciterrae]
MNSIDWPVLRSYDSQHLERISLPLGGIGTGTLGLGGRGDLRDFELGNRPGKGFRPSTAFFAVRAQAAGQPAQAMAVEGPLPTGLYEGAFGSPAPNHGLPRFRSCSFDAAYPFGQVRLQDDDFPLAVTLQGFNPLVIGDVETSSLPVAVLRHRLTNRSAETVQATVAFSLTNFVGANGTEDQAGENQNTYRTAAGLAGVTMTAPGLPHHAEAAGEMTMAVLAPENVRVSHRTGWADLSWGNSLLDFWDDLLEDGRLDERVSEAARPTASIAGQVTLAAGESTELTFLLTWSFPHRRAWRSEEYGGINIGEYSDAIVGNAYAVAHPDSWLTAVEVKDRLADLEAATVDCIRSVVETDAPAEIREAALFNLSTLRSPTVFQTAAGDYYGWEGVGDREGSCYGTCTHVWGYEFATSLLFAPIARSFRYTQFARCTDEAGLMSFRAGLPLELSQSWKLAAADGQMACLVHLYLDWVLSGDDSMLRDLWPAARRTLEFCWLPGGWDADRDGVMEGVQHNTMDVEYYGPNPQMGSWYLAALRAAEELATAAGDPEFASYCRKLFTSGSEWVDEHLFNGSYYRHEVRPVADADAILPGLRHRSMGSADTAEPDLQLADGCLVDQLVGQYAATLVGLGELLDPRQVNSALLAVRERNFRGDFTHHFNHMRSFVLGNEAGVLMCSYDEDRRPRRPFPYFNEVMTGFEYTAATGLLQIGAVDEGREIIRAIRDRYDGAKRNPFDEAECGHHYARAMASWSAFATWNGISYSGVTRTLRIEDRPRTGRAFWSTGSTFGTWEPGDDAETVGLLHVLGGPLAVATLIVGDLHYSPSTELLTTGSTWRVTSVSARP